MNLANAAINFIIYVYQKTLLTWLPVDLPGISFTVFKSGLDVLNTYIITPIYFLDKFLPVGEFFILLSAYMTIQITLWLIRLGITGYNAMRGSGARV